MGFVNNIGSSFSGTINRLGFSRGNPRQKDVKIHRKPKTPRIYNPVYNINDLLSEMQGHGDRRLFTYFRFDHRLADISYIEFYDMVMAAAAALTERGLGGKKIAVTGETCPEWICMYLATLATGGIAIPMDRELSPEQFASFLDWVDADAIVYSGSLIETMKVTRDTRKNMTFICFDSRKAPEGDLSVSAIVGEGIGKDYTPVNMSGREDEPAEYLFTSGTTGTSKCVVLSQKNIFSVVTAACETVDFNPDDVIVSVLPMHHTYELACTMAAINYGMRVCINDSLSHTLKNFKLFRPTGLVLVPLFVQTIHKKIWSEAKKKKKDYLLRVGIIASGTMSAAGLDMRRKIFADVLDAFGGRLEKIICGGAALDPVLIEAFENFGISVYEGFGITECAPLAAVTPYYARKYGSVGPAVPCCEIAIDFGVENDKGYPEGEILVKGDNVMLGYYENPEVNAETFTADGYFRTGDIGYLDRDGYLFITGRKKSVIVLENGKNVFPEEIEEYLSHIEEIAECVVVGRDGGGKVDLTALIYPNYEKFKDADDGVILRTLEKEIATMNKGLPTFKRVMRVELRHDEFEKTSAKKIKRYLVK